MIAKIPGAGIGEDANSTSLTLKNLATADNSTFTLNLQTAEADIAQDDVLGKINFQAPAEGTGTDANLIAASIQATSEGDFSSSSNATKLEFMTGSSEAATSQMTISSGGIVGIGATLPGDLGVGLHVKTADSGASVDASADELVIENSANAGMTIASGASSNGIIYFADSGSTYDGYINYSQDDREMTLGTAQTAALKIDATGAVTKPLQPAFQARGSSNVTDYATSTTHDVVFGTEVFDQNADFASNTFTAPITGKYALNASLYLINAENDASYHQLDIVTSNRNNYAIVGNYVFDGNSNYYSINIAVLADMDANDTAKVQYYQAGGSQTTDSSGIGSWFSGHLVC